MRLTELNWKNTTAANNHLAQGYLGDLLGKEIPHKKWQAFLGETKILSQLQNIEKWKAAKYLSHLIIRALIVKKIPKASPLIPKIKIFAQWWWDAEDELFPTTELKPLALALICATLRTKGEVDSMVQSYSFPKGNYPRIPSVFNCTYFPHELYAFAVLGHRQATLQCLIRHIEENKIPQTTYLKALEISGKIKPAEVKIIIDWLNYYSINIIKKTDLKNDHLPKPIEFLTSLNECPAIIKSPQLSDHLPPFLKLCLEMEDGREGIWGMYYPIIKNMPEPHKGNLLITLLRATSFSDINEKELHMIVKGISNNH